VHVGHGATTAAYSQKGVWKMVVLVSRPTALAMVWPAPRGGLLGNPELSNIRHPVFA
jgi:hypothetical protein